jgi:hypothetical protein
MTMCVIGAVCFFAARSDAGFREPALSVEKEEVLLVCARQMLSREEIVLDGEALTVLMAGRMEEISPGTKAVAAIEGDRLSLTLRTIWKGRGWTVFLSGTPTWQETDGSIFWEIDRLKIGKLSVPYRWVRGLLRKACTFSGVLVEETGIRITDDAIFPGAEGLRLESFALRDGRLVTEIGGISQAMSSALSEKLQELWEKAKDAYPELSSVQEFFERIAEKKEEDPSLSDLWNDLKNRFGASLPKNEKN